MPKEARSYTGFLTAAIFILMEVAAVILLSRTSNLQNIWINRATHRVLATLWGSGESIRNYFTLDEQNEALSRENGELLAELHKYRELAYSYEYFASIADTTVSEYRSVPATIIKASRNTQHNYIILDKGSRDGVRPHSGIITPNGVVGVIESVSEKYSYGITLMNSLVSVSARVGKTGIVAPLEWDRSHSDKAILRDLPMYYKIVPGDTVWTSGYSNLYPSDIPLGTIEKAKAVDGSINQVVVKLFLDFRALRYVNIVENRNREEIETLEEGGDQQ